MLAIVILSTVLGTGIFWMLIELIGRAITGRKNYTGAWQDRKNYTGAWQYCMGVGGLFLLLAFAIQYSGRQDTRTRITKFEATRRTIESMPKDRTENTGIYKIIVEKNEWLATAQAENAWYWIGDLSTDDGVTGMKPLSIGK